MNALQLDLTPSELTLVQSILQKYLPNQTVWAFGSRVKGMAKKYSDLDLAIIGATPLSIAKLAELHEAFSESDLPFKVDIVDWATTSEHFQEIIQQNYIALQ